MFVGEACNIKTTVNTLRISRPVSPERLLIEGQHQHALHVADDTVLLGHVTRTVSYSCTDCLIAVKVKVQVHDLFRAHVHRTPDELHELTLERISSVSTKEILRAGSPSGVECASPTVFLRCKGSVQLAVNIDQQITWIDELCHERRPWLYSNNYVMPLAVVNCLDGGSTEETAGIDVTIPHGDVGVAAGTAIAISLHTVGNVHTTLMTWLNL